MSLRVRLLAITMALLTAGVLVTSAVAVEYLRQHLVQRVDTQLQALGGVVARLPDGPPGYPQRAPATSLDLIQELYLAQLDDQGRVTAELRGDGGPRLPRLDAAAVAAHGRRPFDVAGWRVLAVPRIGAAGSVVIAAEMSAVTGTLQRMWTVAAATVAVVLAVLTVVGWFAVKAGLRPLRRIETTAAAFAGPGDDLSRPVGDLNRPVGDGSRPVGDLSRRVSPVGSPRTEVGRLAAAVNSMLDQLAAAFAARAESEARMRRFLGDVSHELRTPLFGIKGFTELYRMGGLREPAEIDRTMRHIEREATRLASLAEDLLLLARLDEPADVLAPAPMDLRTLAADARLDLRALDPARSIRVTGPGGEGQPAPAPVLADEARLRRVVTNLVGNAVAHTPAGTPVRIGVGTAGAESVLEIADAGPGLTAAQAAQVFDRFYRADPGRTRDDGAGAGLGLSIVRSLVAAHGGRIELITAPGAGATFRVVLPAA